MSRVEDILQNFDNKFQLNNWSSLTPNEKNRLRSDLINLVHQLKEIQNSDDLLFKLFDAKKQTEDAAKTIAALKEADAFLKTELSAVKKRHTKLEARFSSLQKASDPKAYIDLANQLKFEKRNSAKLAREYDPQKAKP